MFRDNLSCEPAKKVHRNLRDLDLRTLDDVRCELERLAEEVGVRA
jgi:hypothetical protein